MRNFNPSRTQKLYSAFLLFAALSLICFLLSGCSTITPKAEDLKQVHNTYRQEFIKLLIPAPGTETKQAADSSSFTETLAAIHAFKAKYGEDSVEAQHLVVLEAMIYLQSNQFGMAVLMSPLVAQAAAKLHSGTGDYVRDQLLARSFAYLLTGWQETKKSRPDAARIKDAADGIKRVLDGVSTEDLSDADDGAIYLATSAAIFYVWVADIELKDKTALYNKGSELIGRFLSDSEKTAAPGSNPTKPARTPRIRYIQWYQFLIENAHENPTTRSKLSFFGIAKLYISSTPELANA
jgi:hypothetical protein